MMLTATADDSSPGSPGPAGWARYMDDDCWAVGGQESSANNRGELTAALELLRATEVAGLAGKELLTQCDSQYVINSLTKWRHGWKKRGWHETDGKPVLNSDLVKDLDTALAGRTVRFEWARGHAGHLMNEVADSRTRDAATAFQQGRLMPAGSGWARGGRVLGNREAQQVSSVMSSSTPTTPQTDALF